jgi:hypothetical protein
MLTGMLPYEGRTTAQLAAQHLHSRPRLESLPPADQATIGKALSKDPQQRFASCREMIDSLCDASPSRRPAGVRSVLESHHDCLPPSAPVKTEAVSWESVQASAAAAGAAVGAMTQPTETVPAVRDLPPWELQPADVQYGPTIFVGIGGLAAKTLQALRRRLMDRFGDLRAVTALQLLLVETDAETLKVVTEGDSQTSLENDATVLLPLRQAADYRRESGKHLQWLSRRWIYNIPRSSQTQGLRPLGRLAFVDHCDRVKERIERAIQEAIDPQGLAASARETGLPFHAAPPRIFVVSSISGGTGGGMVLDVAYLIRKALRDRKLSDENLCGILAHVSGRCPQGRDLAIANAYAFLGELNHYSDPRYGYPGDATCGLPAFGPQDAPFSHAYVLNLGEDLEPQAFAAAADKLAKYLCCNAVTPAAVFFDKCRAPQVADSVSLGDIPAVRTFGLCQLGFSHDDVPAAAANELCEALLLRWRGIERAESSDHPSSLSDPTSLLGTQFAARVSEDDLRAEVVSRTEAAGLAVPQIVEQLCAMASREMGTDPESYLLTVLGELVNSYKSGWGFANRLPASRWIIDSLDTLLRSQGMPDARRVCLESALEKHLKQMAADHGAALGTWILSLVSSPKHRVEGAQRTADYLTDHLRALSQEASESMQTTRREIRALEETLLNDKHGTRTWLRFRGFASRRRLVADRRLSQYFRLRIEELTLNGVCRLAGLILSHVAATADRLRNLAADLNRLAAESRRPARPAAGADEPVIDGSQSVRRAATQMTGRHKAELVAEMELALEDELRRVVTTEEHDARRVLSHALRRTAHTTILRALKRITRQELTTAEDGSPQERIFSLGAGLKASAPRLPECGGTRRRLLVVPESLPPAQLAEQLGGEVDELPTVVVDPENDVYLCCELAELPLRRVAAAVLDRRFQTVEVASRLHTRTDVPWSPL